MTTFHDIHPTSWDICEDVHVFALICTWVTILYKLQYPTYSTFNIILVVSNVQFTEHMPHRTNTIKIMEANKTVHCVSFSLSLKKHKSGSHI
jgi:hypothetical protein